MTDIRDKAIEALNSAQHAPMETHNPSNGECMECPWPLYRLSPEEIADGLIAAGVIVPTDTEPSDEELLTIFERGQASEPWTADAWYAKTVAALRAVYRAGRSVALAETKAEEKTALDEAEGVLNDIHGAASGWGYGASIDYALDQIKVARAAAIRAEANR